MIFLLVGFSTVVEVVVGMAAALCSFLASLLPEGLCRMRAESGEALLLQSCLSSWSDSSSLRTDHSEDAQINNTNLSMLAAILRAWISGTSPSTDSLEVILLLFVGLEWLFGVSCPSPPAGRAVLAAEEEEGTGVLLGRFLAGEKEKRENRE